MHPSESPPLSMVATHASPLESLSESLSLSLLSSSVADVAFRFLDAMTTSFDGKFFDRTLSSVLALMSEFSLLLL
jgi:hypothetical protein